MKAVILAAGFGSRLKPLTETVPKSLTVVNGTPLLLHSLDLLSENGITETVIVLGHMREKIVEAVGFSYKGMKITYVENSIYRSTNNVYSLYMARDFVDEDFLLLECDLYLTDALIKTILKGTAACNILVSPYNAATMDGTVIEADDEDRAKALVLGKRQGPDYDYSKALKTVNVYKMSAEFAKEKYFPLMDYYVKNGNVNSYYELVLGALVYLGNDDIRVVRISEDEWAEVDTVADLEIAEKKFGK